MQPGQVHRLSRMRVIPSKFLLDHVESLLRAEFPDSKRRTATSTAVWCLVHTAANPRRPHDGEQLGAVKMSQRPTDDGVVGLLRTSSRHLDY
jgi:hypothetical protein